MATDLLDVTEPTPPGVGIESELEGCVGRCQDRVGEQRQLAGVVMLVHVHHHEVGV